MRLLAFLIFAALLSVGVSPCTPLDSKVFTVTERTLSVDLDPSFELYRGGLNTSTDGLVSQDFVINDTEGMGVAFLSIMSIYDEIMMRVSPEVLSQLFLIGGISEVEERGDVEIGNWTCEALSGEVVTVHTMATEDERVRQLGGTYEIAVWSLDPSTYALMVSLFDRNTTERVIGTLEVG